MSAEQSTESISPSANHRPPPAATSRAELQQIKNNSIHFTEDAYIIRGNLHEKRTINNETIRCKTLELRFANPITIVTIPKGLPDTPTPRSGSGALSDDPRSIAVPCRLSEEVIQHVNAEIFESLWITDLETLPSLFDEAGKMRAKAILEWTHQHLNDALKRTLALGDEELAIRQFPCEGTYVKSQLTLPTDNDERDSRIPTMPSKVTIVPHRRTFDSNSIISMDGSTNVLELITDQYFGDRRLVITWGWISEEALQAAGRTVPRVSRTAQSSGTAGSCAGERRVHGF